MKSRPETRLARRQAGFTVLEVMIVVALVSIISTIAIPRWIEYRGRAVRSEMHTNLPVIHKLLMTYYSDNGRYTDNMGTLGFKPQGEPRYIYGFTSDGVPAASGLNDTREISGNYSKAKMVTVTGLPLSEADLPPAVVTTTSYVVGAAGNIDFDDTLDLWVLDKANGITVVVDDIDN